MIFYLYLKNIFGHSTFGRCIVKMHWNNFISHYGYRVTVDFFN